MPLAHLTYRALFFQKQAELENKRRHIVQEMLKTEKDYVARLHLLHHVSIFTIIGDYLCKSCSLGNTFGGGGGGGGWGVEWSGLNLKKFICSVKKVISLTVIMKTESFSTEMKGLVLVVNAKTVMSSLCSSLKLMI